MCCILPLSQDYLEGIFFFVIMTSWLAFYLDAYLNNEETMLLVFDCRTGFCNSYLKFTCLFHSSIMHIKRTFQVKYSRQYSMHNLKFNFKEHICGMLSVTTENTWNKKNVRNPLSMYTLKNNVLAQQQKINATVCIRFLETNQIMCNQQTTLS